MYRPNIGYHMDRECIAVSLQDPVSSGSLIVFPKIRRTASPPWTNPLWPRVAVFYSYNHAGMQFHRFR